MVRSSMILRAVCAVCLCESLATAKKSFRARKFVKRALGFDSLAECEVAYDNLSQKCGHHGEHANEASFDGGSAYKSDLAHDARGDSYGVAHHDGTAYHPPAGRSGEPDDTNGWDYRAHGEDWDHIGTCGDAHHHDAGQSPVDLPKFIDVRGQTKHLLWFDYYVDPDLEDNHRAKIVNDGHGLFYDVPSNKVDLGFVKIGRQEYAASEYNFHAPSEHTLDGATFPLEVQIMNRERNGNGIVGVSVLFREGKSNPFLAALKDGMNGVAPTWSVARGAGVGSISGIFSGAFDLESLIPKSGPMHDNTFYNYAGSLTQPPCTSGVDWWVLSSPIQASRDEIRFVRTAIFDSPSSRHGNARSVQPIGDRAVWAGLVGFQHAIKYHSLPQWRTKDAYQEPRGYNSQDMPWGPHWEPAAGPAPAPAPGPAAPGAPTSAVPASPA